MCGGGCAFEEMNQFSCMSEDGLTFLQAFCRGRWAQYHRENQGSPGHHDLVFKL